MRSRVSSGGSQSSGIHQESSIGFVLRFQAAFLHQVEQRRQQAESQCGISSQKCRDVRDQPACPNTLARKGIALDAQRGNKDQKESDGQGEDSERDCVVKPPRQKEQPGNRKPKQRFAFASADRNPAMGLNEHFHNRDEMEEEGHAAEVHAPPSRTL